MEYLSGIIDNQDRSLHAQSSSETASSLLLLDAHHVSATHGAKYLWEKHLLKSDVAWELVVNVDSPVWHPEGAQSHTSHLVDMFRPDDFSACLALSQRFQVTREHKNPASCRQPQRVLIEFADENPVVSPSCLLSNAQTRRAMGQRCGPAQRKATRSTQPKTRQANEAFPS